MSVSTDNAKVSIDLDLGYSLLVTCRSSYTGNLFKIFVMVYFIVACSNNTSMFQNIAHGTFEGFLDLDAGECKDCQIAHNQH